MKKRILALLLAGLITTASFASCVSSEKRPDDNDDTEESQTIEDETDPVVTVTWIDVNQTVYVITSSMTLTSVDDNTKTIKVSLMDELKRVQISSDDKRSVVEKEGKKYYASSATLSTEDLLGKTFTACDKTMYTKGSANVRKYASSQDFSSVIKTFETNTEVKVVAQGTSWSKIKYDENNYYFIYSSLLSNEQVIDHDKVDYSSYFTDIDRTTLYVTASSLRVRKNASTDSSEIDVLTKDAEVYAIAQGTVEGTVWYKILIPDAIQPGQTQTYTEGYVTDKYVSTIKGGAVVTLDSLLEQYPEFVKRDPAQQLYVSADSINVRSTPLFPASGEKSNIVESLIKKAKVTVVAIGTVEGTEWAMIEFEEGVYYFIGSPSKYLTTDPQGNPAPLTLEQLLEKYSFTDIEDKTVSAKADVYYNTTPSNPDVATAKKLTKDQQVTVVASGTVNYAQWYIFTIEGDNTYYFAGAEHFQDVTPEA